MATFIEFLTESEKHISEQVLLELKKLGWKKTRSGKYEYEKTFKGVAHSGEMSNGDRTAYVDIPELKGSPWGRWMQVSLGFKVIEFETRSGTAKEIAAKIDKDTLAELKKGKK